MIYALYDYFIIEIRTSLRFIFFNKVKFIISTLKSYPKRDFFYSKISAPQWSGTNIK